MRKRVTVRRAMLKDAPSVDNLLNEWFDWTPIGGRLSSIFRAIRNKELLVALVNDQVIGFIHSTLHEDIIDGAPNSFISSFYVSRLHRGAGVGTILLQTAIEDSLAKRAVGMETSTIHSRAKKLYERNHFKQTVGDIGEVFLELDVDEYLRAKKAKQSQSGQ